MKTIIVDQGKCSACRLCELQCSFTQTGSFNPSASKIKVEVLEEDFFFLPVTCQQCDDPHCAAICPSEAIKLDLSTGATVIDYELCIGCRMCLTVCPFGGLDYSTSEAKVVKCDLCGGDPACVKGCPWGALSFAEAGSIADSKRKQIAARMREVMKEVV